MSEQVKHSYESIIIVDASKTDDEIQAIVNKIQTLIEKNATITNIDVWGKRKLAYPINYKNDGYYVLVNFDSVADFPKELDRVYGITDGLLRTIITRLGDAELAAFAKKLESKKAAAKAKKAEEVTAEKAEAKVEEAAPVEAKEEAAEVVAEVAPVEAEAVVEAEATADAIDEVTE
ncbi:MAG: 30S ribosomal protein S6 [Clostridiales bacterium]|jgi:small subunit ribosomal protein S6|nr:30S ribosomal protein S6 [Clostridiales bacterium]